MSMNISETKIKNFPLHYRFVRWRSIRETKTNKLDIFIKNTINSGMYCSLLLLFIESKYVCYNKFSTAEIF